MPSRSVTVPTTQVFRTYAEEIGLPLDGFATRDAESGRHHLDGDERIFVEPGDCLLMYEQSSGRRIGHGVGERLTYAMDETLRNCLRPGLRRDGRGRVAAIHHELFRGMLQDLEVWSTGDFILALTGNDGPDDRLAPFERLAASIGAQLHERQIKEIRSSVAALFRAHRSAARRAGEGAVFAVMLGFLLDELIARSSVPNGAGFWFTFAQDALTALLSRLPGLRERIVRLGIDADGLTRDVEQLLAGCSPDCSPGPSAERAAETLRYIGFTLRRPGDPSDDADYVFIASNMIWRWVYFLERPRQADAEAVALRWLHRPWGILTLDDVHHAYGGLIPDDEGADVPAAFRPVVPMLRSASPQDYLCHEFGVPDHAGATRVLERFIHCRYVIHRARLQVRHVHLEPDDLREIARELIDVFTEWADVGGRLPHLGADLGLLGRELRSGQWCADLKATGKLTVHQSRVLQPYLDSPARTCDQLFRFDEPDFVPAEHIGLMPPEKFTIRVLPDD
ncbi:hypothetical protein [Streptomyces antibioticus]|uniref:hypothetical protein n=1 Tax=Streptomyces antibioticus TaxID=1890 RepID=UPI0033BFA59E